MTTAGKLRHRIIIERATVSRLPSGGNKEDWLPYATVWAAVDTSSGREFSGREFFAAQQLNAEVTHRIRIRYRDGITPKDRVNFGGRIFRIETVINVQELKRELQLLCVEVVS